jgi:hypothetical protein
MGALEAVIPMSLVLMSKRELSRLDVLARLDGDRLTVLAAAGLMNVTPRQTYRLLSKYRGGAAPIRWPARRRLPSPDRPPRDISTLQKSRHLNLVATSTDFQRERPLVPDIGHGSLPEQSD